MKRSPQPARILLPWERKRLRRPTLDELVAHHAMLNQLDPIEASRRYAILTAVETHRRAWLDAGQPRLPGRPKLETIESLARTRRTA